MKSFRWMQALTLGVVGLAIATGAGAGEAAGKSATHTPSTELQWAETPIGAFVSPVSGDMNRGEHITYIRFAAGMETPIHTHTHSYVGVVISGTTRHWIPGDPATKKDLATGAHWSIPAGQEHVSECLPGVDCIMAVIQEGAFDFMPREGANGSTP